MIKKSYLKFNDIKIGQTAEFTTKITESMINEFAKISGDFNSLHIDEEYAKNTKFKKRICHGMLLGSLISQLISMHLPINNALYLSQSLNFILPCFINVKIKIFGEIIDKNYARKIISVKTLVINNEKILVEGTAKIMLKSE